MKAGRSRAGWTGADCGRLLRVTQKEEAADLVDHSRDTHEPDSTRPLAFVPLNHQICDVAGLSLCTRFVSPVVATRGTYIELSRLLSRIPSRSLNGCRSCFIWHCRRQTIADWDHIRSTLIVFQASLSQTILHASVLCDSVVRCRHSRRRSCISTCCWPLH
jgi:hypothetical protein